MSKLDAQRAMREAKYARDSASGPTRREAAAAAAGLDYYAIPLGREGVSPDMVEKTKSVLEGSAGPVFCFCRSGTRSTTLWALSQAGEMDASEIIREAAEAATT